MMSAPQIDNNNVGRHRTDMLTRELPKVPSMPPRELPPTPTTFSTLPRRQPERPRELPDLPGTLRPSE